MEEEFYSKPNSVLRQRKLIEYKKTYIDVYFPQNKAIKILDLGCGPGLFLEACKRSGYNNYEGVELIGGLIDYAENELGLSNIKRADIFQYLTSQPEGKYDVISAFNITEHIKKEKVRELLGLVSSRLKSGGVFLLEVPNGDSPIGMHIFYSDITHEFAYTKSLITRLLELSGLDNIKVLPNRVRANPIIRLCQKILAKVVGFDDKLMFSGNIIVISYKR